MAGVTWHQRNDWPCRNKHTRICTLSRGMTALWPYSNGAVQIRVGLELADLCFCLVRIKMPLLMCLQIVRPRLVINGTPSGSTHKWPKKASKVAKPWASFPCFFEIPSFSLCKEFLALWVFFPSLPRIFLVTRPKYPPYCETGVALPLSHCVSCGIADYRCCTPTSFLKTGLSQSKQALEGGYRKRSLPLKPIAV